MEPKKRKESSDYPQFQFRISNEDKNEIQGKIEIVLKLINSKIEKGHKKFKKNDVIVEAMKRGLRSLEGEYRK